MTTFGIYPRPTVVCKAANRSQMATNPLTSASDGSGNHLCFSGGGGTHFPDLASPCRYHYWTELACKMSRHLYANDSAGREPAASERFGILASWRATRESSGNIRREGERKRKRWERRREFANDGRIHAFGCQNMHSFVY